MNDCIEAPRFSVYLGGGLYAGWLDLGELATKVDLPGLSGVHTFTIDSIASAYDKRTAVALCHFSRGVSVPAWIIPAVSE